MKRDEGLDRRLTALDEAVRLAEGRLEPDVVERARSVTAKAGKRLGLGVETTVVALAGPTGVGKSLLFNVLAGSELSPVGRRRPTTATSQAAVWGDGAGPLLDWLDVPRRHHLTDPGHDGLVLLDLPDFDSVETAHRDEVDRVVELADLVLWVVEPQKYADASLHDRYLRPLASHAEAMAVVLNQADLLSAAEVEEWEADVRRLLADAGLPTVRAVVVSARTGAGIDGLRRLVDERVADRSAAVTRLAADVDAAATSLGTACGGGRPAGVRDEDRRRLVATLEEAAGVPGVVRAVDAAHRRRGVLATGWPFVRWVRRLRPDPLRRLRLGEGASGRSSVPPPSDVQLAQVATAVRRLADEAVDGLPEPWPTLTREAATAAQDDVVTRLERAVTGVDLRVSTPRWWWLAGVLQHLLAAAVALGALWLLALAVLGYLHVDEVVPLPEVAGVPIPTWLLVGGAVAGIALAFLSRLVNGLGARRRATRAARALRKEVEQVAAELVVEPVVAELDTHARLAAAIEAASRRRETRS